MTAIIHPIPPGLYCVPAVLVAITGEPVDAVIFPTLNRASHREATLLGAVSGVSIFSIEEALRELGWGARRYRDGAARPLRDHVSTWAARSRGRYAGEVILVCTAWHCLVILDGVVYDNHAPRGTAGMEHAYARSIVTYAAVVRKR